jgi:hypothetical protein
MRASVAGDGGYAKAEGGGDGTNGEMYVDV